jgi:hypothetical protein
MKRATMLTMLLLMASAFVFAQEREGSKTAVPSGSKIFIAPMEGNLHPFIAAEIVKKKLPVVVVTEEKDAEFILTGASIKGDDKWYHSVFGGKDKNEGSVQLISVKDKVMVWAGEAGDRSLWWGSLRRGGQRKVADRIVSKMKKEIFKG